MRPSLDSLSRGSAPRAHARNIYAGSRRSCLGSPGAPCLRLPQSHQRCAPTRPLLLSAWQDLWRAGVVCASRLSQRSGWWCERASRPFPLHHPSIRTSQHVAGLSVGTRATAVRHSVTFHRSVEVPAVAVVAPHLETPAIIRYRIIVTDGSTRLDDTEPNPAVPVRLAMVTNLECQGDNLKSAAFALP